jgi:hypothetical protein
VEDYPSGGHAMNEIGKYGGLGEPMINQLLKNQNLSSNTT